MKSEMKYQMKHIYSTPIYIDACCRRKAEEDLTVNKNYLYEELNRISNWSSVCIFDSTQYFF